MTPLPKRKHTRSRSNKRLKSQKLKLESWGKCPSCGKLKASHRVCPHCGHYGQPVK